jgi:hypothetical protein
MVSAEATRQETRGLRRMFINGYKRSGADEASERGANATGNDHGEYFVSNIAKTDLFFCHNQ